MTIPAIGHNLTRFKSLFIAHEGTALTPAFTGNPSDAQRVEIEDCSWEASQEYIERNAQLDQLGNLPGLVGGKGGKLSFKVAARGCGDTNGHSAAAPHDIGASLSDVLRGACLRRVAQQGVQVASDVGNSTTQVKLSSAGAFGHGNGSPGAPIIAFGADGAIKARLITSTAASSTVTFQPPVSPAPNATDSVWASDVYYPAPSDSDGTAPYYVSFIAQGAGYQYLFSGCRGMLKKISGDARKRVMMEFEFQVTTWATTEWKNAGQEFPAIQSNLVGLNAPFYWKTSSTSVPIAGFDFELGTGLATIATTETPDGNAGFVVNALKPKLGVKPYFNETFATDFQSATPYQALLQIGHTPGAAMVIALPYAQITKFPGEADIGGIVGHSLEFHGYNSASGPLAPAYIAFF